MEPVNFLQSTALKINQEYVGCATDAVMDGQDAPDSLEYPEYEYEEKTETSKQSKTWREDGRFNVETLVFKEEVPDTEKAEEVAAGEEDMIIETAVSEDAEDAKETRYEGEPILTTEVIEIVESIQLTQQIEVEEVVDLKVEEDQKDKEEVAESEIVDSNLIETVVELNQDEGIIIESSQSLISHDILSVEDTDMTPVIQPVIHDKDEDTLFLQLENARIAEELLLGEENSNSNGSLDQEKIDLLLKDSEDAEKCVEGTVDVIEEIETEDSTESVPVLETIAIEDDQLQLESEIIEEAQEDNAHVINEVETEQTNLDEDATVLEPSLELKYTEQKDIPELFPSEIIEEAQDNEAVDKDAEIEEELVMLNAEDVTKQIVIADIDQAQKCSQDSFEEQEIVIETFRSADPVVLEEVCEAPMLEEGTPAEITAEDVEEVEELPKLIPIEAMRTTENKNENDLPPELIPITKPNNRLLMAQLIERKLQGELEDYDFQFEVKPKSENLKQKEEDGYTSDPSMELHVDDEIQEVDNDNDKPNAIEELIKKPIIGCVRKSVRKTERERLTKPPWLIENEAASEEDEDGSDVDMEIEEEVAVSPIIEQNKVVTNGIDMRAKLASQLMMLKVKKKTMSLFDAKIPDFSVTHHEKRVLKNAHALSKVATASPSPLGLKIVSVAGGIDLESCKKTIVEENDEQLEESDKSTDSIAKEVIINDHLDLPTIKLTKTKDYKKIKGWSKKKLLTLDADEVDVDEGDVDAGVDEDPTPSCSYAALVGSAASASEKSVVDGDGDAKSKAGNVFASNSLDGFLQEKDLNISYNVPNLKSTNHNINLLDACMLVDVEEDKARKLQTENEEDSSSQSSFKERVDEAKANAYKPRTLAEKRKMLIDEQDGIEPKRMRGLHAKQKKFSRRPISLRFENAGAAQLEDGIGEQPEENLLVPLDETTKTIIGEALMKKQDIVFLTEQESKPKGVTSQLKLKSSSSLKMQSCAVITRKPVNLTIYSKCTDIKRKGCFDLIPQSDAQRNKLSILQTPVEEVTYRPGPLCKKKELQVNGCKDWQTVVVNLPRVNVEVLPQVGKKISPAVRPFVKFNTFDINKNRAEYAVSVLRSSTQNKTEKDNVTVKFSFPTTYAHKQEKIVMRKVIPKLYKKKTRLVAEKPKPETPAEVLNACESVISGMLNYVETKELGDTLLKYDSDVEEQKEQTLEPLPPSGAQAVAQAKRRDFDPVFKELRRLNVRTVDLINEEKPEVPSPCASAKYCHLGCVCHSIASRYPPWNHCGEAKCIFTCVCGFEARCTRGSESKDSKNAITERALNRYYKEAKKNITAREERDFTQTAIRAKNKTIILGNNRVSKRVPKYNFKRYEGFQFSFSDLAAEQTNADKVVISETFSQKLIRTDKKLNHCQVDLVRCTFDDIVPFCLVHNLYDCHCMGFAEYSHVDMLNLDNQLREAQVVVETPPVPVAIPMAKRTPQNIVQPVQSVDGEQTVQTGGKTDFVTNPEGLSARMRGTGEFFRERNKTNRYKNIMARKLKYDTTVDPEIVNRWVILPLEVPGLNKVHLKTREKLRPVPTPTPTLQQSMSLEAENMVINIDDDTTTNNSQSRQRRKRKHKPLRDPDLPDQFMPSIPEKPKGKLLKVIGTDLTITGALYSPTTTISKQFSQMINQKLPTPAEFRLLLWPSMMKLYEEGAIQIWISTCANKLRFIITDSLSNPKTGYMNIRTYQDTDHNEIKVDLIKWIITKTVPENKNSENMLVILKIQNLFWEICGICAKNLQNNTRAVTDLHDTQSEESIHTVSEKYYKTVQHVVFANGTFAPKQLMLLSNKDVGGEYEMSASLPHIISNCRWRMLRVNSTFAILAFTRNEFRIKCSDILTVMKVAVKYDKTIIINTVEVSQNYQHKLFGIYIPPTFSDRIFIGPYLPNEEHGLETLRYVNNDLMNTEKFNKMRGIRNPTSSGLWYYQIGRAEPPGPKPTECGSVIDLTDIDEVRTLMKSTDVTITPTSVPVATKPTPTPTTAAPPRAGSKKQKKGPAARSLQSLLPTADVTQLEPEIPLPARRNSNHMQPKLMEPVTLNETPTTIHNGIEHVDVDTLPEESAATHDRMPQLIKLPLKPNRTNKNITQVVSNVPKVRPADELRDIATLEKIVARAKVVDAKNLERCFAMRLQIIMKQMKLHLPLKAKPICFRLNFGNGIILAYTCDRQVYVFWPGDCKRTMCFPHLENAVDWLSRELHEVFICVPSTFRIMVTPVGPAHYLEYINRGIISQKYFKEICIIGDFGIMRLSEAQRYLMYSDKRHALNALRRSEGKSSKFKKAIAQIIEGNDMTKAAFQQRVRDLIEKAKAAADDPTDPDEANEPNQTSPSEISQPTSPETASPKEDEVICLDSDDDKEQAAKEDESQDMQQKDAPSRIVVMSSKAFKQRERRRRLKKRQSLQAGVVRPWFDTKAKMRAYEEGDVPPGQTKKEVMQIDLTHMTTEKVKEMFKQQGFGKNIALTMAQVNRLKALSRSPNAPPRNHSNSNNQNGIS